MSKAFFDAQNIRDLTVTVDPDSNFIVQLQAQFFSFIIQFYNTRKDHYVVELEPPAAMDLLDLYQELMTGAPESKWPEYLNRICLAFGQAEANGEREVFGAILQAADRFTSCMFYAEDLEWRRPFDSAALAWRKRPIMRNHHLPSFERAMQMRYLVSAEIFFPTIGHK